MPPTLDEAVDNAVNGHISDPEPVVEVKEEPKVEVKEEPKVEPEVDPEIQQAINLYRALKDPEIGQSVVRELARKAGVLGAAEGKSTSEISKTVLEVIQENLSDEHKLLANDLSHVISAVVKSH